MEIEWSPLATERVIEIAGKIALDKPDVAMEWASRIFDSAEKLREHPRLGRIVPEIQEEDYRELIEGNYRIIYLVSASKISVLTVRHGKQVLSAEELK